jgi:hypothetical protein
VHRGKAGTSPNGSVRFGPVRGRENTLAILQYAFASISSVPLVARSHRLDLQQGQCIGAKQEHPPTGQLPTTMRHLMKVVSARGVGIGCNDLAQSEEERIHWPFSNTHLHPFLQSRWYRRGRPDRHEVVRNRDGLPYYFYSMVVFLPILQSVETTANILDPSATV